MTNLTNIYFGGENLKRQFNSLTIKPQKQMEVQISFDVKKLQNLGFENVEAGDFYYYFDYDGYSYKIDDVYDTIQENLNHATFVSGCCGEDIDSDWMICPNCLEHI